MCELHPDFKGLAGWNRFLGRKLGGLFVQQLHIRHGEISVHVLDDGWRRHRYNHHTGLHFCRAIGVNRFPPQLIPLIIISQPAVHLVTDEKSARGIGGLIEKPLHIQTIATILDVIGAWLFALILQIRAIDITHQDVGNFFSILGAYISISKVKRPTEKVDFLLLDNIKSPILLYFDIYIKAIPDNALSLC